VDSYASEPAKRVDCFHNWPLEKTSSTTASSSMAVGAGSSGWWWGITPKVSRGSALRGPLRLPRLFLQRVAASLSSFPLDHPTSALLTMPPRKKAKASAASTPLGDSQPKTLQDELLNDAWADEQETQLFKSMMKWKPTGGVLSPMRKLSCTNSDQAYTSTFV
jgi:hypothetical protein